MAAEATPEEEKPQKKSKLPLIIGAVLMLVLGGGSFFVTWSGMLFSSEKPEPNEEAEVAPLPDIAFIPLEPIVISLGEAAKHAQFRMTAQLEVSKPHLAEVELLKPRVLDVLNGYLRAIEVRQLQEPGALVKLRAQMLRRIQVATGRGRVRDLLISEFVIN